MKHNERAHSKFSASGSERWFSCPGSVALCETVPSKDTEWSVEGTLAHEVLEISLLSLIKNKPLYDTVEKIKKLSIKFKNKILRPDKVMIEHARKTAHFIYDLHETTRDSEILVETRVYLDFIHPEMFGTFDGAVIDHFGTLHVFDFKYGAGHAVSPKENLQMIFYGIGIANKHHWNFNKIRLWIIQPRIKGYNGPLFWDVPILEMKKYVQLFREAVEVVENYPDLYREGSWCHFCNAKNVCPLKQQTKTEKARIAFLNTPIEGNYGNEEKDSEEEDEDFYQAEGNEKSYEEKALKREIKKESRYQKEWEKRQEIYKERFTDETF